MVYAIVYNRKKDDNDNIDIIGSEILDIIDDEKESLLDAFTRNASWRHNIKYMRAIKLINKNVENSIHSIIHYSYEDERNDYEACECMVEEGMHTDEQLGNHIFNDIRSIADYFDYPGRYL